MLSKVERLRLQRKQRDAELEAWRAWAAALLGVAGLEDARARQVIAGVWEQTRADVNAGRIVPRGPSIWSRFVVWLTGRALWPGR